MRDFFPIYDLPNVPAVCALYSGGKRSRYVAYVGIATRLKQRAQQHLIRRDSSVATGVSAVSLLSDHVTDLSWWEHPGFSVDAALKAAELIAFDILTPVMRSRGKPENTAKKLLKYNGFTKDMEQLFTG